MRLLIIPNTWAIPVANDHYGGVTVISKGAHTSFTSAYASLKDAVKAAASHLTSAEL